MSASGSLAGPPSAVTMNVWSGSDQAARVTRDPAANWQTASMTPPTSPTVAAGGSQFSKEPRTRIEHPAACRSRSQILVGLRRVIGARPTVSRARRNSACAAHLARTCASVGSARPSAMSCSSSWTQASVSATQSSSSARTASSLLVRIWAATASSRAPASSALTRSIRRTNSHDAARAAIT